MDYLELIFHVDIGEGHLEHFDNADGLDFELQTPVELITINGIQAENLYALEHAALPLVSVTDDLKIPKALFYRCLSRRGPPTIS